MWSWIGGRDQPNATGNYNTLGQEHFIKLHQVQGMVYVHLKILKVTYIYGGFLMVNSILFIK